TAFRVFRTISTKHTGTKAIDARVKMAMCNINMGDFYGARQELQKIRTDFPDYERMSLVNKLLSELP
ncbi:MAG: tetratricopeptide repeat protein, partial [Candidatus Cloacimonadaceae bacterium]|nr:tetratricopeptide repeat protein [Candidatus Cloacimonadaceae bacterium]